MNTQYDFLIVGAGLYGATFAHRATRDGLKCLVVERRPVVGGNLRCENIEGVTVHSYGPHIFHTSDRKIWDFVNSLVPFTPYKHEPMALDANGVMRHLPFNMYTFEALWGVKTPEEARGMIELQRASAPRHPHNLEEQAIAMVGTDIYNLLVKGYNEKQWGRPCTMMPSFLIQRIPLRFSYDNNYFDDVYTGVPVGGYNGLIEKLLEGSDVRTGVDFFKERSLLEGLARHVVFTGRVDEYFDYCFGRLDYRTLRFEYEVVDKPWAQPCAVITDNVPEHDYIRSCEHKHFHPECAESPKTVIIREYPLEYQEGMEALYPVNDVRNTAIHARYRDLVNRQPGVTFGGRLAEYHYYDMAPVIKKALSDYDEVLSHMG
ncbi:MAG: UDP-galactopyranose mutase [Muribaculaceae bacterium]|nr:UDP-galactopyranose mutase [Muribaculaceae bacterium]